VAEEERTSRFHCTRKLEEVVKKFGTDGVQTRGVGWLMLEEAMKAGDNARRAVIGPDSGLSTCVRVFW